MLYFVLLTQLHTNFVLVSDVRVLSLSTTRKEMSKMTMIHYILICICILCFFILVTDVCLYQQKKKKEERMENCSLSQDSEDSAKIISQPLV